MGPLGVADVQVQNYPRIKDTSEIMHNYMFLGPNGVRSKKVPLHSIYTHSLP